MENKQKAIEKAYGEHWETVKDYVDENGWLNTKKLVLSRSFYDLNNYDVRELYVRPKTLQGIETNNGWINIESEDDLPKFFGSDYWVILNDKIIQLNRNINNQDFWKKNVTHYQPIQKPKPPIY